jgi:hypothetical protein
MSYLDAIMIAVTSFSHIPLAKKGTFRSLRGFLDKSEARLVPCNFKLYSGFMYGSKDDRYMNC